MNNQHGAGKGDADRTSDPIAYAKNLAEVNFPNSDEGFEISRNGKRKTKYYGVRLPKPEVLHIVPPPTPPVFPGNNCYGNRDEQNAL